LSVLDEIREAYARLGIELESIATYGTYYRLRCARCGKISGSVGDKLLPGMIAGVIDAQFELYAAGLIGCECGYQAERAQPLDPERAAAARAALG
jgi:hypothetical protein